ncbi:MAG: hypothetical protein ACRD0H_09815 [Actinomycetes bacterium]
MDTGNTTVELQVFADYHQFTLEDEQTGGGEPPDDWGVGISPLRLLAAAPGMVGIGTLRNVTVPVTIEVRDDEPADGRHEADHITEASLDVPSGTVVVLGGTDYRPDAPRVTVVPRTYHVRVYYDGFDTISTDGLDGEDHYLVVLWPGEPQPPRVLKQYQGTFPGG